MFFSEAKPTEHCLPHNRITSTHITYLEWSPRLFNERELGWRTELQSPFLLAFLLGRAAWAPRELSTNTQRVSWCEHQGSWLPNLCSQAARLLWQQKAAPHGRTKCFFSSVLATTRREKSPSSNTQAWPQVSSRRVAMPEA